MGLTNFPNGISSMGVPINQPRAYGNTYFVDSTNGSDGNRGKTRDRAFKTITKAFATVSDYDTILLSPGNHTGNYTTPLNADAAFVAVRGFKIGDYGMSTWMGATTSSSPIIDVRARGWTFTDIEFDCPTAAAAIRLNKVSGLAQRCDFTHIENCIFTTGKYGIMVQGGGTHVTIKTCKFDQLTTSGGFGIFVNDTSFQIPAFWLVENCIFATSVNHIGPGNATLGFNESTFKGNIHQWDSGTDPTTVLDTRASGGTGNMVVDCYFDVGKGSFNASTKVRGNSTDVAMGCHFNDGDQTAEMKNS